MIYYNKTEIKILKNIIKEIDSFVVIHYTNLMNKEKYRKKAEETLLIFNKLKDSEDIINIKKMLFLMIPIQKMLSSKLKSAPNKIEKNLIELNELYCNHNFEIDNDLLFYPNQYKDMPLSFEESLIYLKDIIEQDDGTIFELRKNSSNVKGKEKLKNHHILLSFELGFLEKINDFKYKRITIL